MTQTPPREITIHLPKPHPTQAQALKGFTRFNLMTCGRRWGKDVILNRRGSKIAISGKPVAWFAPSYKMLLENWRELRNILAPVITRANEQERRLDLLGGGVIEMWSLENPDAARGRKYAHAVLNEAAMIRNLGDVWNMVIRPTLADLRGSADFASTPRGLNDYYRMWTAAGDDPDWSRSHFTTWDNPKIDRAELADLQTALPERVYRQEIMAEFVEDGSYFQNISERATIETPDKPDQHKGHTLYYGLDWAMSNDYTALTTICLTCGRVVDWDRFNQIEFGYQRERVVNRLTPWGVVAGLPERNSIGEPNIELLRGRIPIANGPDGKAGFLTTATSKPMLIQALASALENGGLLIPTEYADELRSYQVELSQVGHPKFNAPDGQHDDRVISLALAWWAASTGRTQIFL